MFRNSIKLVVPSLLCLSVMLVCLLLGKPAKALQNLAPNTSYDLIRASELVDLSTKSNLRGDLSGLGYLQMEPLVISSNDILDAIRSADERLAIYPEDIVYMFPLRSNYPIKIRNTDQDDKSIPKNKYVAIGFIDANGERQNFKVKMFQNMFGIESRNDGNLTGSALTVISPELMQNSVRVADASGSFHQLLRNSRFTLVVKDTQTGKIKRLRVNPNAVCRDALNAVLTQNLKRLPLF